MGRLYDRCRDRKIDDHTRCSRTQSTEVAFVTETSASGVRRGGDRDVILRRGHEVARDSEDRTDPTNLGGLVARLLQGRLERVRDSDSDSDTIRRYADYPSKFSPSQAQQLLAHRGQ
jgi:hypothetical protein